MAKRVRKTGKPQELEQADNKAKEPTLEQFVQEMHGQLDKPQDGLPSLEWIKQNFETKSAAVRYLTSQGHPVRVIAKHLGMKYQHVRNVSVTPLKRGPNEDWRQPKSERQSTNWQPEPNPTETKTKPVDD